jgi:hypothetical protein
MTDYVKGACRRAGAATLILWATLAVAIHMCCGAPEPMDFERLRDASPIRELEGIPLEQDTSGIRYSVLGSAAFPFKGKGSEFLVRPRMIGEVGLFCAVYSQQEATLEISRHIPNSSGEPSPVKIQPIRRGVNEIFVRLDLQEGETVSIRGQAGRDFQISTPLIYRILPDEERQLVFLISADTLSARHMGLFDYPRNTTPRIDAFAEDGVVFTRAFANSSWTVSSHMSLFTSLLEHRHMTKVAKSYHGDDEREFMQERRYIFPLPPSIPSLVENLSRKMITISVNGGANVSANFGFYKGFDLYLSRRTDLNDPRAAEGLFAKVSRGLNRYKFPRAFYFLHTYHVHMPYNPEVVFLDRVTGHAEIKTFDFFRDLGGMRQVFRVFPEEVKCNIEALYDAEIVGFDHFFGGFIDFLKIQGLYENSLIILLSDHGEAFQEHGSWAHATDVYNEQIQVPLIIKFPGQSYRGTRIHANVSLVDVLPTILDYFGQKYPRDLDGASLMGLIKGEESGERAVIASLYRSKPFSFLPGRLAMIQGDIKLIYNESGTEQTAKFFIWDPPAVPGIEGFDMRKDPREQQNLFRSGAVPGRFRKMHRALIEMAGEMEKNTFDSAEGDKRSMPQELIDQLKALGYIK